MNRDQFKAVRRMYRTACKLDPMALGTIEARTCAVTAMRAATGKWDTCEPIQWPRNFVGIFYRFGKWEARRPHVAAACTRWLSAH
jgi:hypothetical protein